MEVSERAGYKMTIHGKFKGFTIIEVVLVLAIASLIFLMVFIALPALQKSQRDTARKNEVGLVVSAITTFSSNNRGKLPTSDSSSFKAFQTYFDNSTLTEPTVITLQSSTKLTYSVVPLPVDVKWTDDQESQDLIKMIPGGVCNVGNSITKGNSRQVAVIVGLESAPGTYYCANT